ncbi:STAS-like domain-containing protein [uncultured Jannaschia sp.]|uniref:STAS-like domain-containing protein n=1 Tax=uncultured Jannaschia sp. TaxID=293347 RepID=UPI002615122D|nr:STAS-like domain-containing protein [uncultured Jannaschia sp.]
MTYLIRLADFSRYPAGRVEADGDRSGKLYRDTILVPKLRDALSSGTTLTVDMNGIRLAGSSFFEEAFGGLVREGLFDKQDVLQSLQLIGSRPGGRDLVSEVKGYICDAKPQ